ncbi:(2Fe-2S)-binding protein [Actinomadura rayongensis]|uniref:Ferric siderophore reductase C-terminal domain-containing protein n=1 Tax=Actinomadura rayongensis TaxID=1429076 RepID=A0A6I4WDK5_9ACTN|nr:(2Fe-2S)-binding protein [Actinomadura rayongensis]MXQ66335.1 hypothetical protein [Actinomadura rayongensis]
MTPGMTTRTLGPYFAFETDGPEPGWRTLGALFADVPWTARRVADVADVLGTEDLRVAASIWQLGMAARLWSPVVGALVAEGVLLDLDPGRVWWRPVASGPLPLRIPAPTVRAGTSTADVADVMTGLLDPLAALTGRVARLAPGLLRGNAASALAGAVRTVSAARPDLAPAAHDLGRRLLGHGTLRGTGTFADGSFRRRSCCLYYRVPGGGTCGDCPLTGRPVTRA